MRRKELDEMGLVCDLRIQIWAGEALGCVTMKRIWVYDIKKRTLGSICGSICESICVFDIFPFEAR